MGNERRLDQVVITVDGVRLPAELYQLLTLTRVEESVHLPDAFVLRFDDPHFELVDRMTFTMGTRVDIAFAAEGDPVVVTRGEVTSISVEQGATGRHELVLSGLDLTHRLARGPRTRSFQNVTDADIVTRVATDHGLSTDIDPTREVHEYVLQSSESDYAFLKRRAEQNGYDVWVADGVLLFKQKPQAAQAPPALKWGTNLHKFRVRFSSAERCDEVTVRGADPVTRGTFEGRSTEGDAGTTAPAAAEFTGAARRAFGEVRRFAGQFPVSAQSEADAMARSLLLKASGEEVVARGEALGDPMIAAGAEVEIAEVGQKLAGRYRITSVEHVYGAGSPYVTRFVCGGKDPAGLVDLMGGQGAGSGAKRGWGSLVVGLVTNIDDPQRIGRVRVEFRSLPEGLESSWARVLAVGAGKERGLQNLPEVGDQVLVGFEHDDKRYPVVLGGLWNADDQPPPFQVQEGKLDRRSWHSRNGHYVELNDTGDDKGFVMIHHGAVPSSLYLERSSSILQAAESLDVVAKKIRLKADTEIVLEAAKITVKAGGELTLKGAKVAIN